MEEAKQAVKASNLSVVPVETPPHNMEAEQGLLGALMANNRIYDRIADFLRPEHFYDALHQKIYALAADFLGRGDPVSPTSMRPFLENDQSLGKRGGGEYLARLAMAATPSVNVEPYARIIAGCAARRTLINTSRDMHERAMHMDTEDPLEQQIESAEQRLYEIGENNAQGGFQPFSEVVAETLEGFEKARHAPGHVADVATGFHGLDNALGGLHKSDLMIIAGRPGMGKTAMGTNIAFNAAKAWKGKRQQDGRMTTESGAVVGFFSLEMSSDQLTSRIVSGHARVQSDRIRTGHASDAEMQKIIGAANELKSIPLYIDQTGAIPLPRLAARARRLKRQKGLDLLVIDYLQLITTGHTRGAENRVQEVSQISRGLKALAKELDIPIIALSQLSRQVETRDDKRPQLADLRESGSIEQDADVVMFIYREAYYLWQQRPSPDDAKFEGWKEKLERADGRADLIIGKNRHGPTSNLGVHFDAQHTQFSDMHPGVSDKDIPPGPDDVPEDSDNFY